MATHLTMKDLLISILILSALIAGFSLWGENIPYKSQKEGWAFSDGESGTPIPKDGADGYMNVFVISEGNEATPNQTAEQTQQQTTAQGKTDFPISVTVEKQTTEKQHQIQPWEYCLYGVAVTLVAQVVGLSIVAIVLWLKNKISRRKCYEKCKSRAHKTRRLH